MSGIDFKNLPAFRSTEEILAHPRFAFARDVKAMLALYEHKPLLNRLMLEASRTVLPGRDHVPACALRRGRPRHLADTASRHGSHGDLSSRQRKPCA